MSFTDKVLCQLSSSLLKYQIKGENIKKYIFLFTGESAPWGYDVHNGMF